MVMTTYNHERYIATAIESVLRQQTDFRVEIVVGEDCSTDRTLNIVEDYQRMYPDCVRVVTSEENVGWRKNYRRTIEAARGKYIALLDGDDYFTHRKKLQLQIELLEANPDVGMCYTRSERVDEEGNTTIYPEAECYTDFESMLRRNPAENCTVVARKELVEQYYAEIIPASHPEWLTDDLPMWLWFSATQKIVAIDRVTAVHRVLATSVSHSIQWQKQLDFCYSLDSILLWFDERYTNCQLRNLLARRRQNRNLWILSYHGSISNYLKLWYTTTKQHPRLIFNIAPYALFAKKILWRMWR